MPRCSARGLGAALSCLGNGLLWLRGRPGHRGWPAPAAAPLTPPVRMGAEEPSPGVGSKPASPVRVAPASHLALSLGKDEWDPGRWGKTGKAPSRREHLPYPMMPPANPTLLCPHGWGVGRNPSLGYFLPHFLFLCDSVTLPSHPKAGLLSQTSLSHVVGWAEPHL